MSYEKYSFIKNRLNEIGKDQQDLARYLGLPNPRITEILKGERAIKASEVTPLAEFLKINRLHLLDYISGRTDDISLENDYSSSEKEKLIEALEVVDFVLKENQKNMTIRDMINFAYDLIEAERNEKDPIKRKENIIKIVNFNIKRMTA